MSHIPFRPIQSHDNTEQARIYPAKLKHIVPRRQSAIIAGLNKCKILTGTNASNWSRTRGYISPLCSSPLPGMYLCSLAPDHPGRLGEARPATLCAARPRAPRSSGWEAISISNGILGEIRAAQGCTNPGFVCLFGFWHLMRFKCAQGGEGQGGLLSFSLGSGRCTKTPRGLKRHKVWLETMISDCNLFYCTSIVFQPTRRGR